MGINIICLLFINNELFTWIFNIICDYIIYIMFFIIYTYSYKIFTTHVYIIVTNLFIKTSKLCNNRYSII